MRAVRPCVQLVLVMPASFIVPCAISILGGCNAYGFASPPSGCASSLDAVHRALSRACAHPLRAPHPASFRACCRRRSSPAARKAAARGPRALGMEQRGEEGAPAHAREPVHAEQLIVRDAAQGDLYAAGRIC